jgi:uncharacterized protein (TIGR03437 family)
MKFPADRLAKWPIYGLAVLLAALLAWMGLRKDANPDALYQERLETRAEGEEAEGSGREDWFYRQRAYPAKTIPFDAGVRMVEQLEREEARMRSQALTMRSAEPQQQAVWAALGPQPIVNGQTFGFPRNNVSGRVSAIALDPRYDGAANQTVYVGGAQGGVWKSTDNGVNWTPLTDSQPSIATGAITIDPKNPDTIYVGTGEGNRCALCYYGAGLLKSTNGGATWTQIGGPGSVRAPSVPAFLTTSFSQVAIDPSNSSVLYVSTSFGTSSSASNEGVDTATLTSLQVGVWKSTDAGATWRNVDPGGTNGQFSAHDVIVDPRNPSRVFAAMRTIGIFRSEQGGEPGTWQLVGGGLPDVGSNPQGTPSTSPYRRAVMAIGPPIAPSTNTTFYVAVARTNSTLLGIYRSTDNGVTWFQVTNPPAGGQANYNLDIQVDPSDSNVLYYGTSANNSFTSGTLWRSSDGGQTWTDITLGDNTTGGLHADTHQITIAPANPNIVFTGNDGGIWRTTNAKSGPVAWTQLNNGLNLTQFMSLALHPTDPNFIIGGTQDNGTNRFRGNLGWDHIADGDGGFTLIDQSNPQVLYHTFFNQNNVGATAQIGPRLSQDGGNTWLRRGCFNCGVAQGNFNPADRVAFYAPMALNTGFTGENGNVVYFGTHRLYRTADRGLTWTGLGASSDNFGADLTTGAAGEVITTIAGHPQVSGGTEVVWAGTSDGQVQVTANAGAGAGATFTNVTKAPLPNRVVTEIALDPANSQRAIVVYSGFNQNTPSTPGHVFLTTNRGGSWQDISGNLPDVPVTSVAIHPTSPNTIYLGTDLGVFQTTDGGASWARPGSGMPRVATFMVRYHAASNSVVAATHGRGMFRLTTARAATTVSAANFSAASIASEAIVAVFGTGLATQTIAATSIPLPTALAGSRVSVRDAAGVERLSPLFFVSPTQINYQIPPGTVAGAASVTISSGDGTVSTGAVQIATVAPSLFAQNANGQGVPAGNALRVRADNSRENLAISTLDGATNRFVPLPIDLGPATDQVFLVMFGNGIRFRSSLSNVTATIGGANAEVLFAGAQGALIGLDQVNLRIPRSLVGRGEVDVALVVDGKPANTLRVNIK